MLEISKDWKQARDIGAKLRSLGVPSAQSYSFCVSTQEYEIPETWSVLLTVLNKYGITNLALSRIASKLGVITLLSASPRSVSNIFHLLEKSIMLSSQQQKRIFSLRPEILLMDFNLILATLDVLHELGMRPKDVRRIVLTWPQILLLHPMVVSRLAKFLRRPPLSFPDYKVCSFMRRSPWILSIDIDTQMYPSIDWLTEYITQMSDKSVLTQIVSAAPGILGKKRASLHSVMQFLKVEAYLKEQERISVLRLHPRILTCCPETQMRPVLLFLRKTLGLKYYEVSKIFRAFPHILTMDVKKDLIPVVDFLAYWGISDVSRVVKRFPPILGNDIQTDTLPKLEYLVQELGLPMDELLRFPACFSYDLETRIMPRTQFAREMGCSVRMVGLSRVVSASDEDYCRFLRVHLSQYVSFIKNRNREVQSNETQLRF
ncbi:unnamed protein product [Agarophyton chilense]